MGSRTNFAARAVLVPQGLGKKNEASADTTAIPNPLTRTASAMQENAPPTAIHTSASLEKAAEEEQASAPLGNRRASLTKRGAAKDVWLTASAEESSGTGRLSFAASLAADEVSVMISRRVERDIRNIAGGVVRNAGTDLPGWLGEERAGTAAT